MENEFALHPLSIERGASVAATPAQSPALKWAGRTLTGLTVTFLLVDAIGKLIPLQVVVEGTQKVGFPLEMVRPLGLVLAISTVLHIVPRTQLLGAVLLTAYLGGATATHVHIQTPFWFPVIMGIILWISYGLRSPELRALVFAPKSVSSNTTTVSR